MFNGLFSHNPRKGKQTLKSDKFVSRNKQTIFPNLTFLSCFYVIALNIGTKRYFLFHISEYKAVKHTNISE